MENTEENGKYWQNLLPGIESYLEKIDHGNPISIKEVEWIANLVASKTNLNKEQAKIVLRLFFQEIRNTILRGELIYLEKIGNLFLASPKTTGTKKKIFVKFKPARSLIKKINGQ